MLTAVPPFLFELCCVIVCLYCVHDVYACHLHPCFTGKPWWMAACTEMFGPRGFMAHFPSCSAVLPLRELKRSAIWWPNFLAFDRIVRVEFHPHYPALQKGKWTVKPRRPNISVQAAAHQSFSVNMDADDKHRHRVHNKSKQLVNIVQTRMGALS